MKPRDAGAFMQIHPTLKAEWEPSQLGRSLTSHPHTTERGAGGLIQAGVWQANEHGEGPYRIDPPSDLPYLLIYTLYVRRSWINTLTGQGAPD